LGQRRRGEIRDIEELARLAVDCGFKIHEDLGPGLLESVYEAVLAASLARIGLEVDRQKPIDFEYDGMVFREGFRADLLVEGRLIIELKSIERLAPVHSKQLLTYLKLVKLPLGLLMNFGAATFREGVKRVANNHSDFASLRLGVNQSDFLQIVEPDQGA
jgi:iron complex transport system substrate-binding protein